ncbi:MAG: putative toxin-antitoxin system antitoxin component (TIGR02293 family) [Alteromonadaceae bacterium]
MIKQVIDYTGERDLFVRLLNTTSGNLSRLFTKPCLSRSDSEQVLDTIKVYRQADDVFDDPDKAREFLKTSIPALNGDMPIDLLDTFSGRQLVQQLLRKIEYGDFS